MPRKIHAGIIVLVLIILIAVLQVSGLLRPIEAAARAAMLPVARVLSAVGFEAGRVTSDENPRAMRSRIEELEARLSSVAVDYVKLKALEEENTSLRKLASFLQSSGYDHVSARVIARSADPRAHTILIDRGANDGLEIGMAVAAENGIFVGKIMSLKESVSTILLAADKRSRVAASLSGNRELIGLVQGEGGGVASLTFVPQAQPLNTDDVIVTVGTEEKIPANLAIALVNQVEGKQTDPFKTATLEPLARLDSLNLVVVLRPAALRPKE